MTGGAEPRKARRRLPLGLVLCLLPVGACLALGVVQGVRSSRQQAEVKVVAAPLIAALDAVVQETGSCPEKLESLVPRRLGAVPEKVMYRCVAAQKRYLLSFSDQSGLGLPSDLLHQYSSQTRSWTLADWTQSEAPTEETPLR